MMKIVISLIACAIVSFGVHGETTHSVYHSERDNLTWTNDCVLTHLFDNGKERTVLENRFGESAYAIDHGTLLYWEYYNETTYADSWQSLNSLWHSDNSSTNDANDTFVGYKDPVSGEFVYHCDLAKDDRARLDAVYRELPKDPTRLVNITDNCYWDWGYDLLIGSTYGLDSDALKYGDHVYETGDTYDDWSYRYKSPSPTDRPKISSASKPVFTTQFEVVFPKSYDYDESGSRYIDYYENVKFDVVLWIKRDIGSRVDCRKYPGYYRKIKVADVDLSPSQAGYYNWGQYMTRVRICVTYQLDEYLPPGKYYYEYEYNSQRTTEENRYSDNDSGGVFYVIEPDWEVQVKPRAADISSGTLTLHWRIDVPEEKMSDAESDTLLNESSCRFNIWRKTGERYEDFADSELVAVNQHDTYWVDTEFGNLNGTSPVRYWVQVLTNNMVSSERPVQEPAAYCDTRRRFALAVGLSEYDGVAWPADKKPEELGGFVNDTKKFVQLLKDSGGVVEPDKDIVELYNDSATMQGISDALSNFPMKGEKERFVPGDIAFLWIASHGLGYPSDSVGGISAYDGEYQHSGAASFVDMVDGSGVKKRNTYLTDLSWVDDYQGVRVIGILPFCYAEKMTRGFDKKENVAWIANTRKDEQSTLNDTETQFGHYFLQRGWEDGFAYRTQLRFWEQLDKEHFGFSEILGNEDGVLSFRELANYAACFTVGRSNVKNADATEKKLPPEPTWEHIGYPSHVKILGEEAILNTVVVREFTSVVPGVRLRSLSCLPEAHEETGMIRLVYEDWTFQAFEKQQCDAVIIWFRKKGDTEWKWRTASSFEKHDDISLVEYSLFESAVFFGTGTEEEYNAVGTIEPNTEYEFMVQGVNAVGYGRLPYMACTGRTGNISKNAKDRFNAAVSAQGGIRFATPVAVGESFFTLHLCACAISGGYSITAHIGSDPVVSAFVADINDDGTLTVETFGDTASHSITDLKLSLDGAEGFVDGKRFRAGIVVDKQAWPDDTTVLVGEEYEGGAVETTITGDVTYASKNLPKGLSIDSSTGVISGTPTVPGSYVVKVTVTSKTDKTQTETIEVPIVIGNYVDETIAVEDEYGPYVPGEAVAEVISEGASWKVTGLPTGLKWDAKLPGVTGVPTKPGTNTVYFTWTDKTVTPNVEHKASSTFIVGPMPKVTVVAVGETNGCKVTGGGAYLANKSVTLKATAVAAKKATGKTAAQIATVFAGWYESDAFETNASTCVSLAPSYTMTIPAKDVTLYAKFIAQAADVAAVSFELPDEMTNGVTAVNAVVDVSGCSSLPTVKISGLPMGLKFTDKLVTSKVTTGTGKNKVTTLVTNALPYTIYGTPTKSGVYMVVATVTTAGKKTASRSQTVVVRKAGETVVKVKAVLIDAMGTIASTEAVPGKVTGSGIYAVGKKVTLKATANKGYVFAGWYPVNAIVSIASKEEKTSVSDAMETIASTCVSRLATYTIDKMPANDVELVAAFITSECDKANITTTVNGMAFDAGSGKMPLLQETNIWAGVYLEWPVAARALSQTTVKVAGLPSGLKFTDKPVTTKTTSGSGKTKITTITTNVSANTIYGAPGAASKVGKPSVVKLTVTTAGKSSQTYQINTTVDPLPTWAQGSFEGGWETGDATTTGGQVSLAVSSAGKMSGKALGDGMTYTLAAPYYSGVDVSAAQPESAPYQNVVTSFLADVTASWSYKIGTKTTKTNETVQVFVRDNGIGGYAEAFNWFDAYSTNWKIEPWKSLGKKFDKDTLTYVIMADGAFSESADDLALPLGEDVKGKVTLKFSASGKVTIAGEFVSGYDTKKKQYATVKATGSSTLIPEDDEKGLVFVYLMPKGLAAHTRCLEISWPVD